MTPLAAYLLLFLAVGIGFIFVHLVAGKLIRPDRPHSEKGTIYECGEPTIGSAWVQFDLRFYVVALLFVIFDVEVAFFFPWAEVFGKANAIVNAPEPKTADEYNEVASRVLDLGHQATLRVELPAIPEPNEPNGMRQARIWKALRNVTQADLDAYNSLSSQQKILLGAMKPDFFELVRSMGGEVPERIRGSVNAFNAIITENETRQKEAAREFSAAFAKLSADQRKGFDAGFVQAVQNQPEEQRKTTERRTMTELAEKVATVHLLSAQTAAVRSRVASALPEESRKLDELAEQQAAKLADGQKALEKELLTVFTNAAEQNPAVKSLVPGFVGNLSPLALKQFSDMTPEQAALLPKLSLPLIRGLEGKPLRDTRSAASSLAWLALLEILFFFGVLLVGFAYLWKRGDLTWVRSLSAEEPQRKPVTFPVPAPLVGTNEPVVGKA